jgi:hypothetical protein
MRGLLEFTSLSFWITFFSLYAIKEQQYYLYRYFLILWKIPQILALTLYILFFMLFLLYGAYSAVFSPK